jgi:hypothetical protein
MDRKERQVENISKRCFSLTRLTFLPALPGKPKSFYKRDRLADITTGPAPRRIVLSDQQAIIYVLFDVILYLNYWLTGLDTRRPSATFSYFSHSVVVYLDFENSFTDFSLIFTC